MDKRRDIEKLWYFDTEEDFSGKSLSLSRKVDLKSYNDYETIGKSPDWIDWSDSESLEFDFVAKRILKIYADRFILQASEYGIGRYERILGIEPGKNESLEDRRKRVYLLWNKKIRYTDRSLREMLDVLLGKTNYRMALYYNEYGFEIEIFVGKGYEDDESLYETIRQIIPANLNINTKYGFAGELEILTSYGTYNYPAFLCGEHPCGDIPDVYAEAQRFMTEGVIEVGSNYAKNYYPTVNKIKSGDVDSGEVTEVIYASDFTSEDVYSFERSE
ncbi:putative phage tail protein [Peptoniphilus vaginalis]|uniref:putative phage tail protein n=1 Tax=Peptoniphilus vaginalis TaxID=1756987 RepID=UPI0023F76E55|nr:putative phage tail protein [Peptoniphilus vaginalis]